MRALMLIGILLVGVGGYVVFKGMSYRSEKTVVKVGEFEAKVEQQRSIPAWAGGLAIVGGVALVVAGARKRT